MSIKIGDVDLKDIKIGETVIKKVCIGETVMYTQPSKRKKK